MLTTQGVIRLLILLTLLMLAGCVTFTADPKEMSASPSDEVISFAPSLRFGMCVRKVTGGEPPGFWAPIARVGDEQFREALSLSLENHNLLATEGGCVYAIDADILGMSDVRFPDGLVSHETVSNVNYKVFADEKPILFETVTAPYTAKAFSGNTRMVEAREGAIRSSIVEFIRRLSKLKPPAE